MSERLPFNEMCINCPNRGRVSRLLARVLGAEQLAAGCDGPVNVAHGEIVTQVRYGEEPSPPKDTWNSMIGSTRSAGGRRYRRTDWTTEDVCGRETIKAREGEIPYFEGDLIRINRDGGRYAAFIKGDDQEITDYLGVRGIMQLLDSAYETQPDDDDRNAPGAVHNE